MACKGVHGSICNVSESVAGITGGIEFVAQDFTAASPALSGRGAHWDGALRERDNVLKTDQK